MAATTVQEPVLEKEASLSHDPVKKAKLHDLVRHNFITYLFLGFTCNSFLANLIFMGIRFSGLKKVSSKIILFYSSIFLFMLSFGIPILLTFEEKMRNQYPKNLLSMMLFVALGSATASIINMHSLDENVWLVCYLSLFSFLFFFVIGSSNFVDLSNPAHGYILTTAILLILSGIFVLFSYLMGIATHLFVLGVAFLVLMVVISYIIFESKQLLDSSKIDPSSLTIQELTKTITYIHVNFIFRILNLCMSMKEPA